MVALSALQNLPLVDTNHVYDTHICDQQPMVSNSCLLTRQAEHAYCDAQNIVGITIRLPE